MSVLQQLGGEHEPVLNWRARHPNIKAKAFKGPAVPPETGMRDTALIDLVSSFKRANQRSKDLVVNSPSEIASLMEPMGWKPAGIATLLGFILEYREVIEQIEPKGIVNPLIWACGSFTRLPRILPIEEGGKKVKPNWDLLGQRAEFQMLGCTTGGSPPRLCTKSLRLNIHLFNCLFIAERI